MSLIIPLSYSHRMDTTTSSQFSISDFSCPICLSLLYKPTVNTCGHAFCFWCRFQAMNLFSKSKCPICRANYSHFPRVCGVLNDVIVKLFPNESAERQKDFAELENELGNVPIDELESSHVMGKPNGDSSDPEKKEGEPRTDIDNGIDPDTFVHFGVGCDGCGMFPIKGRRYKCQDCIPEIGFDLCAECKSDGVFSSGRFSQGHTADHKVEAVVEKQTLLHSLMAIHEGELDANQILSIFGNQLQELSDMGIIISEGMEEGDSSESESD